ncbi:MAG TPA: D-alanyl-D-alanine carboxypeptidase/D-alanyl-D-alanine-endopeptidase [Terriglobia bacterium]|nr:D-alanyl-D-alanine carboxypeptidase/D-alanyl-D-alanine-endopeptidase [Terriglobia bacterium]
MFNPHHVRRYALLLLALTLLSYLPASAVKKAKAKVPRALGPHIDFILSQAETERGFWGIEVVRLSDGKILYKRNEDHLFMPASNMKLFTTAAALENLGPDYIFRTTVECDTSPDGQGRVHNLILVGRGDANIGSRVLPYHLKTERRIYADQIFRDLADQVVAHGVREIQGDLVADDTYFLYEPYNQDWGVGDIQWGYGAPISALAFNDNELMVHVQPGAAEGATALVSLAPLEDYFQVNDHLETSGAGARERIFIERAPGSKQIDIWGQVPLGATVDDDTVSIDDPPQAAGTIFRKLLEERGIKVSGRVVVKHLTRMEAATNADAPTKPPARVVLAQYQSPPLREDITVTNKVSQNLHAEMLLRTLGREVKKLGSTSSGLEVLADFGSKMGIPPDEYYFTDGCGLSRKALVAPEAMVKLLAYMAHSPNFEAYYNSLPVAATDGTLAERFKGTSADGAIHAKTGTITHVNALSGYMDLPSGDRLAFSILGNSHPMSAHDGARAADQIALAIYEKFGGRKKSSDKKRKEKKKE